MQRVVPPFHWTQLDDVVDTLQYASFFTDERAALPITHVLSKSLPQRCQYRNLREICSMYCRSTAYFCPWLLKVLLCSLGGYYEHCRAPRTCALRCRLLHGYFNTTPNMLVGWIRKHGHVVFYALKELVSVLVTFDPALVEVLEAHYQWNLFESRARACMNTVRQCMQDNLDAGCDDIFRGINDRLIKLNSGVLKFMYRVPRSSFIGHAQQTLMLARQQLYEEWLTQPRAADEQLAPALQCPPAVAAMVHDVTGHASLMPAISHTVWLRVLGGSAKLLALWRVMYAAYRDCSSDSPHVTASKLARLPRDDFVLLNYFVTCMFNLAAITTIKLPAHWLVAHTRIIGDAQHAGVSYVCPACRQFKGFVIRDKADKNYCAYGFSKIMLDDDTGDLLCARREVRYQRGTKRKRFHNARRRDEVKFKQRARMRRRNEEHRQCSVTHLVPVSLRGNVLQCYNKLYALCTNCARPCMFDLLAYDTDGFRCAVCAESRCKYSPFACFFCGVVSRQQKHWFACQLRESKQRVMLCRRHAVAQVRVQPDKYWTVGDLRRCIAAATATRPPRTRRRHRP